ncbi:hypothetical protein BDV34DRAFT_223760 [Aspergillus parasiticus]|uniref:Uncharacterized protein n=1 Tax=Aspergillus parasiticus TaxID=5067 RepID=A0A5N6DQF1_ASPPA|nr:hypothetical protein BDV34DRAFT_223760 [Aspergillus parasiticus]
MVDAYICYKESLRGTTPGLAVFEPVSDDLKAGHCGYFDYLGQWTNIRDLNSITENDTLYKPLSRRVPMSDNGGARTEWSPIFGLGVQVAQGTIQGNAQAPGVNVKGTMTLESTKENAAILMADPVAYCRCEEDQPLKDWLKENEEILMDDPNHRDNILRHGLCIITGVYRTRRCTVGQWRGRGAEVSIELDVGVFNQKGQITGGGSWKKIAGGGYWKAYGFDTANPKSKESNTVQTGSSNCFSGCTIIYGLYTVGRPLTS